MRHVFDPRVAVLWNFLERSNAVESWFRKDSCEGHRSQVAAWSDPSDRKRLTIRGGI